MSISLISILLQPEKEKSYLLADMGIKASKAEKLTLDGLGTSLRGSQVALDFTGVPTGIFRGGIAVEAVQAKEMNVSSSFSC